jgi:hypothetical protein
MLKYVWAERSHVYHDRDFAKERCNTDDIKSRKESDSLAEAQGQSVRVTPYPKRRFCLVCRKAKGVARDA